MMIIVSGANGFLGRYLVHALAKANLNVIAIGRSTNNADFFRRLGVEYISVDVSIASEFKKIPNFGIDAFIHLAGLIPSRMIDEQNAKYFEVNTIGTINALKFCKDNNINKFVYSTTLYEAINHKGSPISEVMGRSYSLTGDHCLYVLSKIAAADCVNFYTEEYGMQGIVLRFTGLLGNGRQEGYWKNGLFYSSAFEIFYRNCVQNKPIEVWGSQQSRKDSLYVKDAVAAIIKCVESPSAKGLYGIGSGLARTNLDDANSFVRVFNSFGKDIRILLKPDIPEKILSYVFDINKAKQELSWAPQYNFEDIIIDYDKETKAGTFILDSIHGSISKIV